MIIENQIPVESRGFAQRSCGFSNTVVYKNPAHGRSLLFSPLLSEPQYLEHHNVSPKPLRWTADADLILNRVKKVVERTSDFMTLEDGKDRTTGRSRNGRWFCPTSRRPRLI